MEDFPSEDGFASPIEDFPTDDGLGELQRRRREAQRAVEEAGGGESEGFELAEEELIEHASHGDGHSPFRIMRDATWDEVDEDVAAYGEADEERKAD